MGNVLTDLHSEPDIQITGDAIYLKGSHEGWIINLLENGIQIISPGCGDLDIEQENYNTINIIEKSNVKK